MARMSHTTADAAPQAAGRLASPAVRAAIRRRLNELGGVVLGLGGLVLGLAVGSHNPADPSFSTATDRTPSNLAGHLGAQVSDVLVQGFGWAAWLPALVLLAWAMRMFLQRGVTLMPLRIAALAAAMPLLAAALAVLPGTESGAAGPLVSAALLFNLEHLLGPIGRLGAQLALGGLAFLTLYVGFGLSLGEWRRAARVTAHAGMGAARVGAQRRHWVTRPLGWMGRALWRAVPKPRFRAEPAADLSSVLRAADEAAAAPEAPRLRPAIPAPEARPAPRSTPRVAAGAKPKPAPAAQPALDLAASGWRTPPLDVLAPPPARIASGPSADSLQANARMLEQVLSDYGVNGTISEIRPGPVVTLYELEPAPGTKSSRVIGLADDIARSMSVVAVRIATVPGRNVIGIELPNIKRETVFLREMLASDDYGRHSGKLPLILGKDIGGAPVIADLARMPHLLIAGTTGSGKSVGINTMILSLLYRFSPAECRFIMIDPKMLELSVYDRIPHLLAPVVTEPPKAIGALKWTVREMERRYRAMSQIGVRNIGGYNEKVAAAQARGEVLTRRVQVGFDPETSKPVFEDQPLALEKLPMIVVVIDEMADLMIVAGKEIEAAVQRLAQMARAAGIHVIMATQRPSVDVITGTIKANFPTRISFQVTSKIDSRTILGEQGAEQLLGQGDMLFMAGGGRVTRVHGPFVADGEVEKITDWLREQAEPDYIEEVTEAAEEEEAALAMSGIAGASDSEKSLFDQAVAVVTREGKASTSFIQRHLNIGYNRAAKLIEQMEKEGVVSPANHVGKREVLARRTED
ncbi:DNA translocase FtsK 4TM domain-containing protein [Roseococcus sp. MDT2-1-1]|uniref:DNA translocase FtsK n=2 Tax=Sabulicella glaciei TaxID=2984948 RepID=A0ABT3NZP6_9PROT|nr:DNA translocase FtsK 4TM domain-containing protein [Roseococcus sp. MDT2-1-1]MCW8087054.1 DNA translocase FtsK 4TM domain-containing protein [Roseococcus sp. MDT2-1-1]